MSHLKFAIPSKGRLKDNCESWLRSCGFRVRQLGGNRGYRAELSGVADVDMVLLSAREIAQGLISGELHIGVTGEDLLNDLSTDLTRDAYVMKRLGFGGADVIVAVPQAWLDVDTMADLEAAGAAFRTHHGRRLRVATKYMALTRRFFAEKSVGEYRLVESAGATEAAPAAGTAEVIVDITSTGATLKANGLKILKDGVMLKSQAALAGSKTAQWTDDAQQSLRALLDNVEARSAADGHVTLVAAQPIPSAHAQRENINLINEREARCTIAAASDIARRLAAAGLGPVEIRGSDFIFSEQNKIYDSFLSFLAG